MNRKAYPYRGFMLDAARHFMPVQDVRRVIEAAAACGMNRMHWHLTDDQGWRLEIKKYPLLTQVGAQRGPSYFGDPVSETENNCGFYSQQDVRAIVAFDLTPGSGDEREAVLQWVFRLTPSQQQGVSLDALPENTFLQKSLKRFLLSGSVVTCAGGPLARPFAG